METFDSSPTSSPTDSTMLFWASSSSYWCCDDDDDNKKSRNEKQQQQQQQQQHAPPRHRSIPFQCIPTLNLVINFFSRTIKHVVMIARISRYFRSAAKNYCDCTWQRLAAPEHYGDAARRLFLDCCRKRFAGWIVRGMIRGGVDVNAGVQSFTINWADSILPLIEACKYNRVKVVALLVAAGADVNVDTYLGSTPLLAAATNGHAQVVQQLLDVAGDRIILDDVRTAGTNTALVAACISGREDVVRVLLAFERPITHHGGGEPFNHDDENDDGGDDEDSRLRLLLSVKKKVDVNLKDRSDMTPLAAARRSKNENIIKMLQEAGAKEEESSSESSNLAAATAASPATAL